MQGRGRIAIPPSPTFQALFWLSTWILQRPSCQNNDRIPSELLTNYASSPIALFAIMAAQRSFSKRPEVVISRGEIEALIAEGRTIIIVNNKVLKVDAWRPYHPGGDKAILHMVGRDATDEVSA